MNAQLVNSLIEVINSLPPEEKSFLTQKLTCPPRQSDWQSVLETIEKHKRTIYERRQGQPFNFSIEEMIEQMREERTEQLIEASWGASA